MQKRGGPRTNYQRQFGQAVRSVGTNNNSSSYNNNSSNNPERQRQEKFKALESSKFGIQRLTGSSPERRRGWLYNVVPTTTITADSTERSGLDLFFCDATGDRWVVTLLHRPYFYSLDASLVVEECYQIETVHIHDLDATNHLRNELGVPVTKVSFDTTAQLSAAVKLIKSKNKTLREYDVPYTVRACTDLDIRVGTWYTVSVEDPTTIRLLSPDATEKAEPTILAFDIECTKAPLKFPDAKTDEIYMISYMVKYPDGRVQGYLIVSRSVVAADVDDFEYTPSPRYPGPFHIMNVKDELELLETFFTHWRDEVRPAITVTYNGDGFDWPFVRDRAQIHGKDLLTELGIVESSAQQFTGHWTVHLDAFYWVQRDSYLPQGAQGLKAVTKYKLGYDPVEVDPEDMVLFAQTKPVHMATYSVSDALATYYLFETYVQQFVFALSTIIPMGPEDVISKGSGTICEALLMVQASKKQILCPNKQVDDPLRLYKNKHVLESETYIGGKVECLETGVYRSDLEYDFDLQADGFQELIDNLDRDLQFCITVEGGKALSDIVNYDEVRTKISQQLHELRDRPKRREKPFIYHLDVGAMYPNIILTNRLQPNSIVDDAVCAACDFNQAKNKCKRKMDWVWRGEYNPATRTDLERTKEQMKLQYHEGVPFPELDERQQAELIKGRLKTYAKSAYKKTKVTTEETRTEVVCMRENDFYVDTVRQFRDRRYEYKALNKEWKRKADQATDAATKKLCQDRIMVYDSLQVAHKCILNSFYGYVMRKGARWRSMEMAGIVTKTGADIITQARQLVERIGRPLELDTDGIWCILPKSFPDVFTFMGRDGSKLKLEYPCVMLNAACHDKFTNHQYQTVVDAQRGVYETHSECSIFFEVDGPYRCMVIPASLEEGKLLKKRYAVFNFDGSLAELKGFELKRRGELELIKTFQSQVFERFLDGTTLEECYDRVASIANHWIDVIDTRGDSLEDGELVDLISENRNMSRQLDDYGAQKGTSQTTARRLGEFLGAEIIKDKGLNCKFIVAELPHGAPVTERAIPTAIWKAEPAVMKHFLCKWLKSPGLDGDGLDMRNILDWEYYLDRLGKTVQRIITIPAALQKVRNPVPRVRHPDWLESKVNQMNDRFQQQRITSVFQSVKSKSSDLEDCGKTIDQSSAKSAIVHKVRRNREETGEESPVAMEIDAESSEKRAVLSQDTFSSWLTQRKAVWRKARSQRRMDTSLSHFDKSNEKKQRTAVSIEGFVRQAAESLAEREWQIIEVRELTSYDTVSPSEVKGTGDFLVWATVGDSFQKVVVSVPRTIYVATRKEIAPKSNLFTDFRRVDKRLPYGKTAQFIYEITMSELVFRKHKWLETLQALDGSTDEVFDTMYESGTPLLSKLLASLGSVSKLNRSNQKSRTSSFMLSDISRIEKPKEGEYLDKASTFKRHFLYVRINPKSKTGVVALFQISPNLAEMDVTRPSESLPGTFDVSAFCSIWIVKPQAKNSQQAVSLKSAATLFNDMMEQVEASVASDSTSAYSVLSLSSNVHVEALKFVATPELAFAGANEALYSSTRFAVLVLNSNWRTNELRRFISPLGSLPVISMPFPPHPCHDPHRNTLPSLNWETPAIGLAFDAYLHMMVISFPKRVALSRYSQVPVGNLMDDEIMTVYEVSLARMLAKNRAVSWAHSAATMNPDVGVPFMQDSDGGRFPIGETCSAMFSQDEIWGDDGELVSPVIQKPGCYRSICIDIDIQDLAIAALTSYDPSLISSAAILGAESAVSPTSINMFDAASSSKLSTPLGDEMSTSVSLPMIRTIVTGWYKDAMSVHSVEAEELSRHIYRLLSNPYSQFHDPALHRMVHSLMKSTFLTLLGELKRLGCSIVFASFQRITVATNKLEYGGAEEYINFVIDTVRQQANDSLSKVSLQPRQYHSNYVFLDEYNFGTMHLERIDKGEIEGLDNVLAFEEDGRDDTVIVANVVTAWSLMMYLASESAQRYFRVLIGRFSKEVFCKQMELASRDDILPIVGAPGLDEPVLAFKQDMVSKQFAKDLTRAVAEIRREGPDEDLLPEMMAARHSLHLHDPAVDFIKNIIVIMELDEDIEPQVHTLKQSLLAQVGVAEYAEAAQWKNPCPKYMLPDLFCTECQESRDVNLCYIPPFEGQEEQQQHEHRTAASWSCVHCGSPYSVAEIERRLLSAVQKKMVRYVLQDVRNPASSFRVASRALATDCVHGVTLEVNPDQARNDLELLLHLAEYHELDALRHAVAGILCDYQKEE